MASNLDVAALHQRAQRAAVTGGVVALDGNTLLRLLDGDAAPRLAPARHADLLEMAYRALVDVTDPQIVLRQLTTGRVVLLSDVVWDKIAVALRALRGVLDLQS